MLAMPGVGAVKVHPVWNGDVSPSALIPGEAVDSLVHQHHQST
ncbi:MAG: hypothetical protein ACLU9S_20440 [Oscillospiraceae bacterium]